ncbi:MAG: biotin--[acetyl-CoA-carboxylase] ligase [Phycisphaerae bacterium]|nr:biotin--[acetyl-CoA-carboxylase] ligase [Phycisphaerae bacterium]
MMTSKVLDYLRERADKWITIEAIACGTGLVSGDIINAIDKLSQQGYMIDNSPSYGFRFSGVAGALNADLIEQGLLTKRVGSGVIVFDNTDSTNNIAKYYADDPDADGLAIFAEHQNAGKGRQDRNWCDIHGKSILCSILLRLPPDQQQVINGQSLSLLAGVAVADAVRFCFDIDVRIKWPNDVMVNGKKLAGVMVQSVSCDDCLAYIIGIGINCQQGDDDFDDEVRDIAVSIRQLIKKNIDRVNLAQELLCSLDIWLGDIVDGRTEKLHNRWLSYCDDINRRMTLVCDGHEFTGRIIDVSVSDGLIMQLDTGGVKAFNPDHSSVKKD